MIYCLKLIILITKQQRYMLNIFRYKIATHFTNCNESPAYLCSPVMSGMPSSDHSGNSNEDKIVKYLNAKMILNSIAKAFKNCSQASFTILKDKYISSLSDWQIAANMYCSKATYFRMRDRAYNEFADCFEVQQGGTDLHIYLHE